MNTVTLQSPDGSFFRRIDPDGSFWQKSLGMEWERHDPATISQKDMARYIETLTKRLKWRICK